MQVVVVVDQMVLHQAQEVLVVVQMELQALYQQQEQLIQVVAVEEEMVDRQQVQVVQELLFFLFHLLIIQAIPQEVLLSQHQVQIQF
jgi:hypothetical protein